MDLRDVLKKFDYPLKEDLIADQPLKKRDQSRLLVLDRNTGEIKHQHFYNLVNLLGEEDVLVLNQSKVFPARLYGQKDTGGKVEVLLITQKSLDTWEVISKPGLKNEQVIYFSDELEGLVTEKKETKETLVKFSKSGNAFFEVINKIGITPIPPYIKNSISEKKLREIYQTVYAKSMGSVAAPTAGLHFTSELLEKLKTKGVQIEYVTLHVGLGTFQNLREENLKTGKLHNEVFEITKETADRLNKAKKKGKRIISVGTTSTRTLESSVKNGQIAAQQRSTQLFIQPGVKFQFVDSMITNFHLPKSSLLMLISSFVSSPNTDRGFKDFGSSVVGNAYKQASEYKYRFFSFGDAMWII